MDGTNTHEMRRGSAAPASVCVARWVREGAKERVSTFASASGDQQGMMASTRLDVWYQQQVSSRCSSTRHASRRSVERIASCRGAYKYE